VREASVNRESRKQRETEGLVELCLSGLVLVARLALSVLDVVLPLGEERRQVRLER
jgi:hypothetical protein